MLIVWHVRLSTAAGKTIEANCTALRKEPNITMTDVEKAITELEDFIAGEKGRSDLHISTAITALTALREKAEREKAGV
jgi:hypothetical protein